MKKIITVLLVVALLFSMAACAGAGAKNDKFVGISMPTQDLQRWNQDGANMKEKFEAAGFKVDLQYANNEVATQVSQIENMISEGVKVLVIAAIDGKTLTQVLATAKDAKIAVIAYDRLIMDTDAVSYYCTFDNIKVGTIQGQYIKDQLKLDAGGSYNIELTTGDPADNNAPFFFKGAMDVLQPYIDSGVLKIPSGQVKFEEVATPDWSTEKSQARMEAILASFYADGTQLDACLCSNDSTAKGVTNALASSYTGKYPIVTGQDCDIANTKDMIAGKQSMSVFKDTRTLAAQTVAMASDILAGKTPDVNDTTTYDNGTGIIPTFLCSPVFADANNYKELLIDSGYYKAEDLK
ncbi:MAG: multiple monosaccharide ABC transporter substrate-binding protein [Eubacteriales bacterium]|nr:multiple monosaccharide ABC transporter substrate-binding protein [Eubacteriales bacterium]